MLCLPSDDDRKWDGGEEDGMAKGEGETMKLHGGKGSTNDEIKSIMYPIL